MTDQPFRDEDANKTLDALCADNQSKALKIQDLNAQVQGLQGELRNADKYVKDLRQLAALQNKVYQLQDEITGKDSVLERCLRRLDPAPDGKQSRSSAGLVPCLLYGGIPAEIAALQAERDMLKCDAQTLVESVKSARAERDELMVMLRRVLPTLKGCGKHPLTADMVEALLSPHPPAPPQGEQKKPIDATCRNCALWGQCRPDMEGLGENGCDQFEPHPDIVEQPLAGQKEKVEP